jgi:hypothetical protein
MGTVRGGPADRLDALLLDPGWLQETLEATEHPREEPGFLSTLFGPTTLRQQPMPFPCSPETLGGALALPAPDRSPCGASELSRRRPPSPTTHGQAHNPRPIRRTASSPPFRAPGTPLQFGRASAPRWPQRMQRRPCPIDGTSTSSASSLTPGTHPSAGHFPIEEAIAKALSSSCCGMGATALISSCENCRPSAAPIGPSRAPAPDDQAVPAARPR